MAWAWIAFFSRRNSDQFPVPGRKVLNLRIS